MDTKTKIAGVAAAAAAGAIWSMDAHAQQYVTGGDVGVYLSLNVGAGQTRVGVGAEGRVTRIRQDFENYYAGVVRLDFRGNDSPRFIVGAQGGLFFEDNTSPNVEIGLGQRWGGNPDTEVIVGLGLSNLVFHGLANVDVLSGNFTVGTGLRVGSGIPIVPTAVPGRPLRADVGFADLPAIGLLDPSQVASEQMHAVSRVWAERAQMEWGSVPTFRQLAEQLALVGAPRVLIERSLDASDDETRHALLSAQIVSRVEGARVILDTVSIDSRGYAVGEPGLIRLATESYVDGCLGEGFAAATAAASAELAHDPGIRATQRIIAIEEQRHADLAWDVLEWALRVGSDRVRDAVVEAADAQTPVPAEPEHDLEEFGVLDNASSVDLIEKTRAEARTRLRDRTNA